MNFRQLPFLICLVVIMVSIGCRKYLKDNVSWETEVLAPLANGSMTINEIIQDTLLQVGADNSMKLVYQNNIYTVNLLEEKISIPDTALKSTVKLDSIVLPNRSIEYPISLGRLALEEQTGIGGLIIFLNGQNATIPPITGLTSNGQDIDASSLFETAVLDGGFLDLSITNGFPVDITNVVFRIKNKNSGNVVLMDSFDVIPKNSTKTKSFDLAGKTVEGSLVADLLNLDSPGSNGVNVPIDTSDVLLLKVTARDLDVFSATAIFPAQNLIDVSKEVTYNMGGPEFTFMKIKSGKLVVTAVNTIEDSLKLNYKIPGARSAAGVPIDFYTAVAPAPVGGSIFLNDTIDLSGYSIDLTGLNNNKVNTFYNSFTAGIDSTGKVISISLDDSVEVFYGLIDIVPEYVKGYVGKHQVNVGPASTAFTLFNKIKAGSLDLEKVDVNFTITNPMGVEGNTKIDYIRAINTKTNTTLNLTAPAVINQTLPIKRGFENPLIPGITKIKLDKNNSNIKNLIEVFPNKLEYKLQMNINPNGNIYNYQDFIIFQNKLNVSLDMEMPLSFVANDLVLQDTFDFKINSDQSESTNIQDGVFTILFDNGFPLDAKIQVYFTNTSGKIIDSLFAAPKPVTAAPLEPTTCQANEKVRTRLDAELEAAKIDRIRTASKVVLKVSFNSKSAPTCSDYVKIYSHYGIDFKLLARFNYLIESF